MSKQIKQFFKPDSILQWSFISLSQSDFMQIRFETWLSELDILKYQTIYYAKIHYQPKNYFSTLKNTSFKAFSYLEVLDAPYFTKPSFDLSQHGSISFLPAWLMQLQRPQNEFLWLSMQLPAYKPLFCIRLHSAGLKRGTQLQVEETVSIQRLRKLLKNWILLSGGAAAQDFFYCSQSRCKEGLL